MPCLMIGWWISKKTNDIMKKFLSILLIFLICISVLSQEDVADYEKFEALAKKVNDIQKTANGKRLKYEETDMVITIPENNFIFNYYNLSANNIVKTGDGLLVFENIDFADVKDIGILDESFGDCGMVVITTNKKHQYTAVVDGKTATKEINNVGFYFSSIESIKGNEMFNALVELIYLSKIKKGLLSEKQAELQKTKWKDTASKNTVVDYYNYWKTEPENIFDALAYTRLTRLDRSFKLEKINTGDFHLGMTKSEFENLLAQKLNEVNSDNEVVKEALKSHKSRYYERKDQTVSTTVEFSKYNTSVSGRKLEKNKNEIDQLIKSVFKIEGKDIGNNLNGSYGFRLEKIEFDKSLKATSIEIVAYPLDKKLTKDGILSILGNDFGNITYKNQDESYFRFSGYADKELFLYFSDSDEIWITLRNKKD